jgi:hypothetical protein
MFEMAMVEVAMEMEKATEWQRLHSQITQPLYCSARYKI